MGECDAHARREMDVQCASDRLESGALSLSYRLNLTDTALNANC